MNALRTSLPLPKLCELVGAQLRHFFPDGEPITADGLMESAATALDRIEHSFSKVDNRYFFDGSRAHFDHLHGDQYAMWLYVLSNQLHRDGAPSSWCKKLFLLNKALHGCDLFYEVSLPSVFLLVHPLGTVLGRATYADHLVVYQRVGVGSNHGVYPTLGAHLTLHPGSSVLGRSRVGDGCSIAAESLLLDRDLPDASLYMGNPRDPLIRAGYAGPSVWRS